MAEQKVVLKIATDVGAVDAQRVIAVCTRDVMGLREGFS